MTNPSTRLRTARERAGYSSGTAAAEAFGWPISTYLGHENGSRGLRKDAAERYARAFGVSWSWLMGAAGQSGALQQRRPIPVAGMVDSGSFRKNPHPAGAIAELDVQVPGFEQERLVAWEIFGAKDHHFLITTSAGLEPGTVPLRKGDEVLFKREADGRFEIAAWRLEEHRDGGLFWSSAYAGAMLDDQEHWVMIDHPDVELLGIVVAEFKLKNRVMGADEL